MTGSFWVDDVALDGDDWFLTNATLLPSVASRRVSQLGLFRGQGVRTAKGGWGLGSLTVDLVVPEGGMGSVASRLRRLQALLAGSSEIRAELDGLPAMACEVVGVDVSDPSRVGIEVWSLQAKFTLQPFWVEDEQVDPAAYAWSGMVNGSPSTETIGGVLKRTNAANNPRFTRTVGTVEVRRNLFNNPGAASLTWQGFSAYAGTNNALSSSVPDAPWSLSGKAFRRTWTTVASPNSGDVSVSINPASSGVVASTVYTLAVKTVTDGTVALNAPTVYDTTARTIAPLARGRTTQVTPLAGEVVTDWITVTTPTSFADTRVIISIANKTVGCWVEQSEVDIYPGTYQPNRKWASGSYSPDPDLTPVWVGTANASQSYLRGFVPGSQVGIHSYSVSSSSGLRSIPINPASNDSNVLAGGSNSSLSGQGVTFAAGKWYGFQVVCTLLAPQTGSLNGTARRIQLSYNNVAGWSGAKRPASVQPPNEARSYQEELVTQLPADSVWAALYLYNGAYFGGGDVYWDKLLIVEGDTEEEIRSKLAQGYFDGASDSGMTQSLTGTGSLVFTQWAGSTGVVRDGILRVSGPATSVSIIASDGTGLSFTQTLTASQCVFIDVERFRAWLGTATDWAETATAIPLDWPPAGPLVLKPSSDGVRLTLNGGTGLALKGRRWWL